MSLLWTFKFTLFDITIICAVCVFLLPFNAGFEFTDHENSLRDTLLSGTNSSYNKRVRPDDYTRITMSLILLSLVDLDIEHQEMSLTAMMYTYWYDPRLTWNSTDYGGIKAISVDVTEVWYPPVLFRNAVDDLNFVGDTKIPFRVQSDGKALLAPPINLKTSCQMDVVYFPFDVQNCTIEVYPFSFLPEEVDIVAETVNLGYYTENAAWEFIEYSNSTTSFVDEDDSYTALTFSLKFKRRWLYMTISLILPTVMNLLLMFGVFLLHVESGEKMGYSLTVLLTYIVLMAMVGDQLPQVSTHICFLQVYLAIVLTVGSLSTLLSIWVINVYNRDDEKYPISDGTKALIKWVMFPVVSVAFWRYIIFSRCTHNICKKDDVGVDENGTKKIPFSRLDTNSIYPTNMPTTRPTPRDTITPVETKNREHNPPRREMATANQNMKPNILHVSSLHDCSSSSDDPNKDKTYLVSFISPRTGNNDNYNTVKPPRKSPDSTNLHPSIEESLVPGKMVSFLDYPDEPHKKPPSVDDDEVELDSLIEQLKWKDIALLIDSFLLRILGGGLLAFTLILMTLFFIQE